MDVFDSFATFVAIELIRFWEGDGEQGNGEDDRKKADHGEYCVLFAEEGTEGYR